MYLLYKKYVDCYGDDKTEFITEVKDSSLLVPHVFIIEQRGNSDKYEIREGFIKGFCWTIKEFLDYHA